jgi:hypothetical protein
VAALAVEQDPGERPADDLVGSRLERQPQVIDPVPELLHRRRLAGNTGRVRGKSLVAFQRRAYRPDLGGVQALVGVARQLPAYQYWQVNAQNLADDLDQGSPVRGFPGLGIAGTRPIPGRPGAAPG